MKPLKKAIYIFSISLFFCFFLFSFGYGQGLKFGLKIIGGMNYHILGDGDAILRGENARANDFVNKYSGYTIENSLIPLFAHFGLDFDADAILYFSPNFGISIGVGNIQGGTIFGSDDLIISSSTSKETDSYNARISATPIKLGIYYSFSSVISPKGKSSSYLYFGLGYYSAKYSLLEKWSFVSGTQSDWITYEEKSKANGIGFHGGLGTESWVGSNFAFVFEIFGRYANIGGFEGDWRYNSEDVSSSGSGKLYFYEFMDTRFGNWYASIRISLNPPSGSNIRNPREAKINFSGAGFRVGIKIHF